MFRLDTRHIHNPANHYYYNTIYNNLCDMNNTNPNFER